MNLINQVKHTIFSHQLIKRGNIVIVGVSGGCDSIALVHILNSLKHELGCQLIIAHFNHRLRSTSDQDEYLVKLLAQNLNLTFERAVWTNPPQKNSSQIEEKARLQRQRFFAKLITKYSASSIALAHHTDDVAETMLMKMIRGAGGTGLSGIAYDRYIDGVRYIRPLLGCPKSTLEEFCNKQHIKFLEDETNTDTRFLRNKIRNNLLPILIEEYNPNITQTLQNSAMILSEEAQFITEHSQKLFKKIAETSSKTVKFDRRRFNKAHTALQRQLIRSAFDHLKGSTNQLTFAHIQRLLDQLKMEPNDCICPLTKGVSARISQNLITFSVT